MKRLIIFTLLLLMIFPTAAMAAGTPKTSWRIAIHVESDYGPGEAGQWHGWNAEFLNYGKELPQLRGIPQLDQEPVRENGRVLVPLRQISEALGYKVLWNKQNRQISLSGKNLSGKSLKISMKIDGKTASVNNQNIKLDAPPRIINGHTLIPLRFISEVMGCYVKYNLYENQASIYITDYPLLNDDEISEMEKDGQNYYTDNNYPRLRPGGHTSRGIKLGDSIAQVLKIYPRGVKQYSDNYTGTLLYREDIPWNCTDGAMVFEFKNGILTQVHTGSD